MSVGFEVTQLLNEIFTSTLSQVNTSGSTLGQTLGQTLGAIPSPSFKTIPFWPRPLTLYGLCIGLGIIAAVFVARPRLEKRGISPDFVVDMLIWIVPAGILGGRVYHIVTDRVEPARWHEIYKGGLGIPGAIAFGALAAYLFSVSRDTDWREVFDSLIPGVVLAQAIGRWGNWFNQELYGRPTDLPWGLVIDRPPLPYEAGQTFHPTFLYESIWNVAICFFLLWLDKKKILKTGRLVWAYAAAYSIGRLWLETVRIDHATTIAGVRVNIWVMGAVLLMSLFALSRSFISKNDNVSAFEQTQASYSHEEEE